MFSIRDHLPMILGVIAVAVVIWLLWRDLGNMKKTLTKVVSEHNETAAVLDQHKTAINGLAQFASEYDDDEDEEEYEPVDETVVEEIEERPAKKNS